MTHNEISDTVMGMKKDEDKRKQLGMFLTTLKSHVVEARQDAMDAAKLLQTRMQKSMSPSDRLSKRSASNPTTRRPSLS